MTSKQTISEPINQPNRPPSEPVITGPLTGKKNILYNYMAVSTDLDNNSIKYTFEWGDGNVNESRFLPSGEPFYINHSWTEGGIFTVNSTPN